MEIIKALCVVIVGIIIGFIAIDLSVDTDEELAQIVLEKQQETITAQSKTIAKMSQELSNNHNSGEVTGGQLTIIALAFMATLIVFLLIISKPAKPVEMKVVYLPEHWREYEQLERMLTERDVIKEAIEWKS